MSDLIIIQLNVPYAIESQFTDSPDNLPKINFIKRSVGFLGKRFSYKSRLDEAVKAVLTCFRFKVLVIGVVVMSIHYPCMEQKLEYKRNTFQRTRNSGFWFFWQPLY